MGNWLGWSKTETNLDKDIIPLDRKVDLSFLTQIGVLENKLDLVLRNLQNNKRYTWGDLIEVLKRGGDHFNKEVMDKESAEEIWSSFFEYLSDCQKVLQPEFELNVDFLNHIGMPKDEAVTALENLHRHNCRTWPNLLDVFRNDEDEIIRVVGSDMNGKALLSFVEQVVSQATLPLFRNNSKIFPYHKDSFYNCY